MEIDSRWIYNINGLTNAAKQEFLAKVPKLSFVDVRRYRWPFCQALIKEAYEEGYFFTAEFLLKVSKRNDYFVQVSKIKNVCNCRQFLLTLMDGLKSAEKCAFFSYEEEKSLTILLNIAVQIEINKPEFLWVSEQLYIVLFQLADHFEDKFEKTVARALYFCGKLLNQKLFNFEGAVKYLQKSLELCKGREWTKIPDSDTYLSKYVSEELCLTYLNLAQKLEKSNLEESEQFAKQAVLALVQGSRDKHLHCKAGLKRSDYLISTGQYEDALKTLHKVYPYVFSLGKAQYKAELFLKQGICYFHLSKYTQSSKKLKDAIRMEGILPFKHTRARILYYLGQLYGREKATFVQAQSYLLTAKDIFEEVGDNNSAEKVKFLTGIQQANVVLPQLVKMYREKNCDYKYKLWKWKDNGQPFWTDRRLEDVGNPIELFIEASQSQLYISESFKQNDQVVRRNLIEKLDQDIAKTPSATLSFKTERDPDFK